MREIVSDTMSIKIKASNMSYTHFYQEFKSDLSDELAKIEKAANQKAAIDSVSRIDSDTLKALVSNDVDINDPEESLKILDQLGVAKDPVILSGLISLSQGNISESLPILSIMKVVWAMNCSAETNVMAFPQWANKYDEFDFVSSFNEIYEEVKRGFFRSGNK